MIGVSIAIIATAALVIYWHRQQRKAKKLGMASWQFIALSLTVAFLAVAAAAYGLGLRGSIISDTTGAMLWHHERNSWIIGGHSEWCYVGGAYRGLRIVSGNHVAPHTTWVKPTGNVADNPYGKMKTLELRN